jgi:transcriptional regulator with XRE-family HTH domain
MTIDSAHIGQQIRLRRDAHGLSLSALAEQSGVSKGYLSQLETGSAQNPSVDTLSRIADALGTPLSDLLGEEASRETSTRRLPRGLEEFIERRGAQGKPLADEDIAMLRTVFTRRRKRGPMSADDWDLLYRAIIE